MVNCYECKFGNKWVYFDHYVNDTLLCVYCEATDDYLTDSQATDDLPCDMYEPKLDVNDSKA